MNEGESTVADENQCAVDGCDNLPVEKVKINKIVEDENGVVGAEDAEAFLCVEHAGVWGFMPKVLVDKLEEEGSE